MNSFDNIRLEKTDCPLCGGAGRPARGGFEPYRLARCSGCGLLFCAVRPTAGSAAERYARGDYFEGQGYASYSAQEHALRLTFRRFLKKLSDLFPLQGALLEIGCGYGYLLDEARPYFQRRTGADFSDQAVKAASASGAEVFRGGLEELPSGRRFDCIILAHVIEHVHQPLPFLRALHDRLNDGGLAVVATPDSGSFWFKLMGRKWASFKIPEHVAFYSRQTLSRALLDAGFGDIRPVPYLHAFPLALVADKLGLRIPAGIGRISCWIPGTTVALAARRRGNRPSGFHCIPAVLG